MRRRTIVLSTVVLLLSGLLSLFLSMQPGAAEFASGKTLAALRNKSAQVKALDRPLIAACLSETISLKQQETGFVPKQTLALAHPTNYDKRFAQDIQGNPVFNEPIIVLHETVGSANSVINFFQTPHPDEDDQASYHAMITLQGTIVYLVPPEKRAFGAGNSVFIGQNGPEAVKTHKLYPASVNNFAYHISLETPPDGDDNGDFHSGYTDAQYRALVWLVSKTGVPNDRITTHKAVDRSGSRKDPRSFDSQKFWRLLSTYSRVDEIGLGCAVHPAGTEAFDFLNLDDLEEADLDWLP